jgi:membrane-bound serine protease (ClpP class)
MIAASQTSALTPADLGLLLLLSGILLLYAEFNRPGTILLGACGAIAMMLGVARLLPLTFSPAAAVLALGATALLLLEIRFPWRGLHKAGVATATVALILALRFLVVRSAGVHWAVAIATGALFSIVTYTLGRIALLAAQNKRVPRLPVAA